MKKENFEVKQKKFKSLVKSAKKACLKDCAFSEECELDISRTYHHGSSAQQERLGTDKSRVKNLVDHHCQRGIKH